MILTEKPKYSEGHISHCHPSATNPRFTGLRSNPCLHGERRLENQTQNYTNIETVPNNKQIASIIKSNQLMFYR